MARVEKRITIQAPPEKVFAYLNDPSKGPGFWPSLTAVKDVEPLVSGGHRWRYVYKMAGLNFEGSNETAEFVPNRRLVVRSQGGIEATVTWTLDPQDGGTVVGLNADYKVPIPVLGKLAEAVIAKMNEREGEVLLENLKTLLEA